MDDTNNPNSLQQQLTLQRYHTFYQNVRNRLCKVEETLDYDFFISNHANEMVLIEQYRAQPVAYHCQCRQGLIVAGQRETTYLVVGGVENLVLLLEPSYAKSLNLPFLSVLRNGFFRPQLECPIDYWQNHVEPVTRKVENVLHLGMKPPLYA